ncbi:hypothetical protein A9498_04020 [Bacillus thuringiensis serovar coreanensis]|uniref:Uncharacterized protein n=1 Tax=Bacillus cereus TaxID=1396 RepID=A0A9X6WV08_BACCE|nr:hypothetical protein A9498_04020 [Bacillus thuringiensis serovar coreanensis]PFK06972.1 hypothetical protein COI98_29020 [Bacillus cereus]
MKELQRVVIENLENGTQVTRLPNAEEMMNKINELVRYTKRLEQNKQSKPIQPVGTVKVTRI